jgi:hypothetical protein
VLAGPLRPSGSGGPCTQSLGCTLMVDVTAIEAMLFEAFPQRVVENVREGCNCDECRALKTQLKGITWKDVPREFIRRNDGALPLLSHDAYLAFLPAWLRQGILEPDGPNARMLLVNLQHEPDTRGFTSQQAAAIIEAAQFMVMSNKFWMEEPENMEDIAEIKRVWSPIASQQGVPVYVPASRDRG